MSINKRLFWLVAALSALAPVATGCGDDDGGGGRADAAPRPDAEDEIDGGGPTLLRSGTVAIFEARVVDPDATAGGVAVPLTGGTVSINFFDTQTGDVVAEDLNNDGNPDSNIGGCAVTIIDVGVDTPSTSVDEGVISASGTGFTNGDFACAFNATAATYVCQSTDAGANGILPIGTTAQPLGAGAVRITWPSDADFGAFYDGMALKLDGFPNLAANGTFPILTRQSATQLIVFNPGLLALDTTIAAGTYNTFIGTGPIPPGGDGNFNFLSNPADVSTVVLSGPANGQVVDPWCEDPGCSFTVNGESAGNATLNLADESGQVAAFPTVAGTPITFSCEGTNGVCGATNVGVNLTNALIISGETTDAELPAANPASPSDDLAMPDPVTRFATFQCAFLGLAPGNIEGTIPAAAVDAILGTSPTRIQTQVIIAGGTIASNDNQEATTNILQGHAVVGFTTL